MLRPPRSRFTQLQAALRVASGSLSRTASGSRRSDISTVRVACAARLRRQSVRSTTREPGLLAAEAFALRSAILKRPGGWSTHHAISPCQERREDLGALLF